MRTVTVLGAGGWGTALAIHVARLGTQARLWARNAGHVDRLRQERCNTVYLPDVLFPSGLLPTASLEEALEGSECIVSAVPSHVTRQVIRQVAPLLRTGVTFVSAAKGIERGTLNRMSEIITQEAGASQRVVVLSGPSFAFELAREKTTAVVVASLDSEAAEAVQAGFRSSALRLYVSGDVTGVEMGGAMKNVIAIAAGVVEGLGLGPNAMAALITRGLAEISRLACAMGGSRETLSGLSGLGDLILTCTGGLSRNRQVGIELGRGRPVSEILAGMRTVAEGVRTTEAALELGQRFRVELPIVTQMADVLAGRTETRVAVDTLMLRRQRAETDGDREAARPL
ncbi:MAG TPA: glycerol-3-phosphate dehydrogenase [Acidobacteria bacterium]|nr:glycerol-3-phosphate dehydrogenase [Acidobacteriota bacterium]